MRCTGYSHSSVQCCLYCFWQVKRSIVFHLARLWGNPWYIYFRYTPLNDPRSWKAIVKQTMYPWGSDNNVFLSQNNEIDPRAWTLLYYTEISDGISPGVVCPARSFILCIFSNHDINTFQELCTRLSLFCFLPIYITRLHYWHRWKSYTCRGARVAILKRMGKYIIWIHRDF